MIGRAALFALALLAVAGCSKPANDDTLAMAEDAMEEARSAKARAEQLEFQAELTEARLAAVEARLQMGVGEE